MLLNQTDRDARAAELELAMQVVHEHQNEGKCSHCPSNDEDPCERLRAARLLIGTRSAK